MPKITATADPSGGPKPANATVVTINAEARTELLAPSDGEVEGPDDHARWRRGRTISQRHPFPVARYPEKLLPLLDPIGATTGCDREHVITLWVCPNHTSESQTPGNPQHPSPESGLQ